MIGYASIRQHVNPRYRRCPGTGAVPVCSETPSPAAPRRLEALISGTWGELAPTRP